MPSSEQEMRARARKWVYEHNHPDNYDDTVISVANLLAAERAGAIEECAKFLDDEVARHRADYEGEIGHSFCEDYGCNSLTRFASALRAKLTPAPEQKEGANVLDRQ